MFFTGILPAVISCCVGTGFIISGGLLQCILSQVSIPYLPQPSGTHFLNILVGPAMRAYPPQEAKAQGDFLLVGIHTDEDVQKRRGVHLPIMNLHERALSVLACKYADEVVIGAPTILTEDIITTFNISVVVRGTISETNPQGEQVGLVTPVRSHARTTRRLCFDRRWMLGH